MADVNIHKRLMDLQDEIGSSPKVEIGEFINWAATRKIKKLLCCSPESLEDIQTLVKAAKKLKLRIRCAGSGHSWAPLFPDEGNILVRVRNIKRHDGPQIELTKGDGHNYVSVMCGVTVEEMMAFQLEHKVNLPCNVVFREAMYGGVIGAGCHGVGWNFKAMSDYVIKMRIIDSGGELRTYSLEEDPDMFRAIQTNLGMFGIMYDITFDLFDEMIAKSEDYFHHKVGDLFYNPQYLKELVKLNDSLQIFWWPHNSIRWGDAAQQLVSPCSVNKRISLDQWNPKEDKTWIKTVNILEKGSYSDSDITRESYYTLQNRRDWIETVALNTIDNFVVALPQELTLLWMKGAFQFLHKNTPKSLVQPLPHAIHYRSNIGMMSLHDMEACFRVDDDFSVVTQACQAVIEVVQEFSQRGHFPLNIAMEMRFMADSNSYLCPAYIGAREHGGTGHTVYIEVLSYTNTPGWIEFCNHIFKLWKKLEPTIHWAKEWDMLDGGIDYMMKVYKTQGEKFVAQLDKSKTDPNGMFLNKSLQSILLPGRSYSMYTDPEETKGQLQNKTKSSKICTLL